MRFGPLTNGELNDIHHYLYTTSGAWILTEADDEHPVITLESIGCDLKLEEVYDKTD